MGNSIKYGLRENLLTADPDDCMAQVVDARTYTQDDIAQEMLKHGSSLTAADIAAYQKLEVEVYKDIIANGGNLNTPLISTNFSITGVFANQTDSFDKSRHVIKLNVNAGAELREAASKASVQKVETSSTDPYITSVTDKISGDSSVIKTGSVMQITGARLKFDVADAEQGVFAITSGGEFRCATVVENKPARLMVLLSPDVPAGDFSVEVRTKVTGTRGSSGKTLKKGGFNKVLTATA